MELLVSTWDVLATFSLKNAILALYRFGNAWDGCPLEDFRNQTRHRCIW